MGRPHRRDSETGIHHVMNRGVDRQPIFFTDADRLEFGRRLAEIHERFGVVTIAYCLMGNHFHLVLRAPAGVLPEAMHHLTSVYSRHVNDHRGRDGPLVRGRYLSIPVETDSYLLWVVRYVHRNALDIAGVRSPRHYRWSSYRAYLGLRPCPPFLDLQLVLSLVGGRVEELAAITEGSLPARPASRDELTHMVRTALAVVDLTAGPGERLVANLDRTLMVLLAERSDDPSLRTTIGTWFGPRSPKAVSEAVRRAEARRADDPVISLALTWIEGQLATSG